MYFVAVSRQLLLEKSTFLSSVPFCFGPSIPIPPVSPKVCHLSMLLVLCSPQQEQFFFSSSTLSECFDHGVFKKGIHSLLYSGTCCYTGRFLHLMEVFWLKFMFSPCMLCSPELLQSQALYKCLWINTCSTFVVRKHSFSHPQKRGRKVHWWFRGVKHWQWELHMKPLVSYDWFA